MNPLRRTKRTGLLNEPATTGGSPAPWPSETLPVDGWGKSDHPVPKSTPKEARASKSVAFASGWGGAGSDWGGGSWGGDHREDEEYEDEDEEYEEEENYRWGPSTSSTAWGAPPPPTKPSSAAQPGWKGWSEEAKRLSKATSTATAPGKPMISQHQQSQILSSLLSQPPSKNAYLSAAQQQQQQQKSKKQQQPPINSYFQHAQSVQPNSTHWPSSNKKDKKVQEKARKQHHRARSEYRDPRGSTGDSWGANNDGEWGQETTGDWEKEEPHGWGKETGSEWGQDTSGRWGKEANTGWGQETSAEWGKETNSAWDQDTGNGWGASASNGWGPIPEEDEYEYEDARKVRFSPYHGSGGWGTESLGDGSAASMANLWGTDKSKDTSYTMPSKTLAHAYNGTTTSLNTGIPRNKINEYTNVQFHDSRGAALSPFQQALFGRARKAKDRIHWSFPPNKDERVESLLSWIQTVSYSLGSYGLHRFLQSRERGALITNADYRIPDGKNEPAFDWLTFDQLRETRDKTLQESVAFYNPAAQVVIFIFLPSPSGNSVAMWRRRINVPNNTRLMLQAEISLASIALRRDEDYVVHVDEYPSAQPLQKHPGIRSRIRRASLPSRKDYAGTYPMLIDEDTLPGKPKKKRKWWQFFW
ncbi:hypothetical protein D9757_000242 [Collybiopsis confluens]|uniref:CcmS related domain-containing protein n=1 Tax=Collybiopsis confluens TaxID=2823264 RepID=A0A8H5I2D8_9AGAR|nr:hypothetical protein D9757_000242 [Collybiopsis confluens]